MITPRSYKFWHTKFLEEQNNAQRWRKSAIAATMKANMLETQLTEAKKEISSLNHAMSRMKFDERELGWG